MNAIALVGSLCNFYIYIYYPTLRSSYFLLVLLLSSTDIANAIIRLIFLPSLIDNNFACKLEVIFKIRPFYGNG